MTRRGSGKFDGESGMRQAGRVGQNAIGSAPINKAISFPAAAETLLMVIALGAGTLPPRRGSSPANCALRKRLGLLITIP
jgi:hypothetical protein